MADREFWGDPRQFQDRRDYIRAIYEEELGRDADEAGLAYWDRSGLEGFDLVREMRNAAGLDPNTLHRDPAYSAFIRGVRAREGQIENDRMARVAQLRRQNEINMARLNRQEQQGLRRVDQSAEARGMFRSGGRISERQRLVEETGAQRAQTATGYAGSVADVNRAADAARGDLSRRRDEEEIAARQRLNRQSMMEAARG